MSIFSKIRDKIHTNCKKSKDNTLPPKGYKDGKYRITEHGALRMRERNITKGNVHVNLHTTPLEVTEVKIDKFGRPSYRRSSNNKITTAINPTNNNVTSVNPIGSKDFEKLKKKAAQRRNKNNGGKRK